MAKKTKKCKGGCGQLAIQGEWCKVINERYVACPMIVEKRARVISRYRTKEAKEGKNPMQNPDICRRNHSPERNKKAAETLRKLGQLGLLPQQKESKELKDKRRRNVKKSLKKLWLEGKHPRQLETLEERKERLEKVSQTLKKLGAQGRLPVQNLSQEEKTKIARKISITLREGIKTGRIKLSKSWKRIPYKKLVLRSEWEKVVAEHLDENNIEWSYENFIIPYWDSQRHIKANTIPDFYLPSYNMIIEIKSNAEYKSQKTLDKMKGVKSSGYKALLFGRKEIEILKNNKQGLLELIHQK